MQPQWKTGASPGRNDPCPCGSGKRFKHCHGSLAADPAIERAIERALAHRQAADLEAALAVLGEGLSRGEDARALNIRGLVEQELRDFASAEQSFRRAIELQPDLADAHFNLGILLLALGDYPRGWPEYAWRTRRTGYADYAYYPFGMPRWQGEPLAGRSILMHAEQGFGDTIQAARFLERLARDGAKVDLFCQPSLVALLKRVSGVRRVYGTLDERPTHDFHAPILDLAAHYLPRVDAPHWYGPYLSALPDRVRDWDAQLAALPRPRIGIAWKGSARQVNDRLRSLSPAEALALTAMVPAASFVNLQAGEAPPPGASWFDAGTHIRDWDDTAAIVASLDLVIAVDTAVAHLGGAMRKPVWTLRWASPDWRWGVAGEEARWYPSMRLYWQQRLGEWQDVLERVARDLGPLATSPPSTGRDAASPP